MQGKVSMVMPCYNKADYIGEMFDSIIAQDWDNIELVLVNDGSTDGTREIISGYEPKFLARGFEVVIVDQKNGGVCAAAKAGLERITGDYVCMVDADDELDPAYVSTMAGWLDANPQYDFSVCEGIQYTGRGASKDFKMVSFEEKSNNDLFMIDCFLMGTMRSTVWIYLLRSEYLMKCNIVNTYYTSTKGSHEPGYIIPLLAFGGKRKHFPLQLYRFNQNGEGHSRSKKFSDMKDFYEEYNKLCDIAIDALPDKIMDNPSKAQLKVISEITRLMNIFRQARFLQDGLNYIDKSMQDIICLVNKELLLNTTIKIEQISGKEDIFFNALERKLLNLKAPACPIASGRIIAWGASGKNAKKYLPYLKGTPLEPSELWDETFDGNTVKKPDLFSLKSNDLILILASKTMVYNEIRVLLKRSGHENIIGFNDIVSYLGNVYFPELQ